MRKRNFILSAFILILATAVLVGCATAAESEQGDQSNTAGQTSVETLPAETDIRLMADDRLPAKDYGGYKFNFLVYSDAISPMTLFEVETQSGDVVFDAIYSRNRAIEERFNVKLGFTPVQPGNYLAETATQVILAGDHSYDIYVAHYGQGPQTLLAGNMVTNWRDVPYIQLDKPWWNQSITENLEIQGYLPFIVGDFSLPSYTFTFAMIFNTTMVDSLALKSPYDMVHNGEWTLDVFSEYIKAASADINGDGVYDEADSYGYAVDNSVHFQIYPMAANISYIEKDKDDYPVIVSKSEKFASLIEKLYNIYYVDNNTFTFLYDTLCPISWDENRVLILTLWLRDIEAYRGADSNYGFLPFPKFDEQQQQYYTCTNARGCVFVAPINTPDLEMTGIIMEALTVESYKSVVPAYYDIALYTKYLRDEESAAMLDIIFAGRRYDFGFFYPSDVTQNVTRNLLTEKSTNFSSYYDSKINTAEAFYKKIYDYYIANNS